MTTPIQWTFDQFPYLKPLVKFLNFIYFFFWVRNLLKHQIYQNSKHDFRRKRGTDTALTIIHETIAHHFPVKRQWYMMQRDASKAFDEVRQNQLKYKMPQLDFPPGLIKILCNFLDQRYAKITRGRYMGQPFALKAEVPQSSSLSPTLFAIYTSDIPHPTFECCNI